MFIRKFDYFSPLITLYYQGEIRHCSRFSGILSIIFSSFVCMICLYISFDFLFKVNPNTYYSKKEVKDFGIVELTNNTFFHYLSFIDEDNNKNYFDDRIYSVIGINNESFNGFYLNNFISKYSFSHWEYEPCNKLNISNHTLEKDFNISLCITKYYDKEKNKMINFKEENFPYPKLQNNLNNKHIFYYGIIIKECENYSSFNNNSCYDLEKIHEIAFSKDRKLTFNYFSYYFDIDNYKKPIISQINKIIFNYNPYFIIKNEINLIQTILHTSDGIFFDNNKELKVINVDNYVIQNSQNLLNIIGEIIEIKMTNKIEIYHRIYKKFQDIIGAIDGMMDLFILLLQIINEFFYHDFRLINDFNEVIKKKVEKIKTNQDLYQTPSFNLNSQIYLNNFVNEKKLQKFSNQNMPIVKNLFFQTKTINNITNTNNKLFNNSFNDYEKKIAKNFQTFSWIQYMKSVLICFKKKKYRYYNKILLLRKKILSEERLLKNYWNIKKMNKGLFDIQIKSNNLSLCTNKQ